MTSTARTETAIRAPAFGVALYVSYVRLGLVRFSGNFGGSGDSTLSSLERQAGEVTGVAIAGGGIGGLTLAVALQRRGFDVTVLERQSEVRDGGAGISLWPNALAALDAIDLGEMVRSIGATVAGGGLRRLDGRTGPGFSRASFVAALGEGLVCVDRGRFVTALAGCLAPGTIRTGCAVTGYGAMASAVTVFIDGRDEMQFEALVGANGIYSTVAAQTAGRLRFSYSGYSAWRAIADFRLDTDGELSASLAGGRELGWMPVDAERTYWFATACLPQNHPFPAGDGTFLREAFGHYPDPVPRLLETTHADALVYNDIEDRHALQKWSDGPVTVLGDAAHPMRPHMGQGGCQAIEDAATLAGCLTGTRSYTEAFALYERLRRRRAHTVVRLSRYSGFTRPPGLATTTFDRLTSSAPRISIGRGLRALAPICSYKAGRRAVQVG